MEQQLRGDFLDSLLTGNFSNADAMVAWGLRLEHKITKSHSVVVVGLANFDTIKYNSEEKVLRLKKEILQIANSFIKLNYPGALCGKSGEELIILLPNEGKLIDQKNRDLLAKLEKTIKYNIPNLSINVGVGRVVNKVADYSQSYQQALKALNVIEIIGQQNTVVYFDDLGSLAILLEAQNKKELLDFMEKKLGLLLEYDEKYQGTLINTLEVYLREDTIQQTAKETSLSVSGLKYRLNKILELGYDLHSARERFDLQLALNILKVRQKT